MKEKDVERCRMKERERERESLNKDDLALTKKQKRQKVVCHSSLAFAIFSLFLS